MLNKLRYFIFILLLSIAFSVLAYEVSSHTVAYIDNFVACKSETAANVLIEAVQDQQDFNATLQVLNKMGQCVYMPVQAEFFLHEVLYEEWHPYTENGLTSILVMLLYGTDPNGVWMYIVDFGVEQKAT